MAGNLAQAEVIGGAVVTITGDLTGLRAAHVDAKRLTMSAANDLRMVATATIDTRQFNTQLQTMKRQAETAVVEIGRAMSRMGNLGIGTGAGLDFKGRSGGGGEIAGEQAANRRQWKSDSRAFVQFLRDEQSERFRLARETGEKEAEAYLQGQQRVLNRHGGGGGGSGGRGGGRGGRIRNIDDIFENMFLNGSMFKIGGAVAIARAGGLALNGISDIIENPNGVQEGMRATIGGGIRAIDNAVPLGSGLNRLQDNVFGGNIGSGLRWMYNQGEKNRRGGAGQILTENEEAGYAAYEVQRAVQMRRMTAVSEVNSVGQDIALQSQMADVGGAEGAARLAMTRFENSIPSGANTDSIRRARSALSRSVAKAIEADNARRSSAEGQSDAAGWMAQAMSADRAGEGDKDFALSQYSAIVGLRATQQGRLAGVTDPKQRYIIEQQNKAESAMFGQQQAEQQADRELQKRMQVNTKIAAENDATLRLQMKNYEADLAAFDAAAQAKLDTVRDVNAKSLQSAINAAQRSVIVAEQKKAIAATNTALGVDARVTELRADGSNQQADLEQFDAETEAGLQSVDAANRGAYVENRRRKRAALIRTQQRDNASFGRGIESRVASANAVGAGQTALAGVYGRIAGARDELEFSDPTRRGQVIRAQRAEFSAMESDMFRPRSYLRGFDPLREGSGDPFIDGGGKRDESEKILMQIRDYMKVLAEKEGGLPN